MDFRNNWPIYSINSTSLLTLHDKQLERNSHCPTWISIVHAATIESFATRTKTKLNGMMNDFGIGVRQTNQHIITILFRLESNRRFYSINRFVRRRPNAKKLSHYIRLCHSNKIYHVFQLFIIVFVFRQPWKIMN